LEQSRSLLEKNGVCIAAVSYDPQETLKNFADTQRIGFPLLSDRDSAAIRAFGIFNMNIAPGLRAHGVPHPVEYLVAPDGTVIRKYFVPNYLHRVTGSAVAFQEFGVASEDAAVITIQHGALKVEIGLSSGRAFAGQELSFFAKFQLQPGWHTYGTPLPDAYTATSIVFEDDKIIQQLFDLPKPESLTLPALGETLPVFSGSFEGRGTVLLRFPLDSGRVALHGKLRVQQCCETICEPPEAIPFELPVTLEPFLVATPKK